MSYKTVSFDIGRVSIFEQKTINFSSFAADHKNTEGLVNLESCFYMCASADDQARDKAF